MSFFEAELEDKVRLLTFDLIYELGDIINTQEIKSFDALEELLSGGRDNSLPNMIKDRKFLAMVKSIKQNFDSGYKQFIYYDRYKIFSVIIKIYYIKTIYCLRFNSFISFISSIT
jgi:hypothetical protein